MFEVNSQEYWNNRFETKSWEQNRGIEQSNLFAELIVNNVHPRVMYETMSMIDFGCALGQLCDKWAYYTGTKDIVGYDFSSVACKKAKELYPNIEFLDVVPKRKFDILISSNLLEHVDNVMGYLHRFAHIAEKYIVVLVPYMASTGGEHIREFNDNSFQEEFDNFIQIQKRIIQCNSHGLWEHKQLLLVYKAC